MSNTLITKSFNTKESIRISESETTVEFESMKTFSLTIDYSKPLIDSFSKGVEDWISRIELNRDLYSISIIAPNTHTHGGVSIKYNDRTLANLVIQKSVIQNDNGSKSLCAITQVKFIRNCDEILNEKHPETIYIDDRTFEWNQLINGKRLSLMDVLDFVLPIRSEFAVNGIAHIFKVRPQDMVFDTLKNRYVIHSAYIFSKWIDPPHPKKFYKYVSLSVFLNMLKTRSFRMNSIVCQSDESESLYFGDLLCSEYETEIARYRGFLNESNILISSFTDVPDNPKMWEEYGDHGKGIMLEFESTIKDILTPIRYVKSESFKSIKKQVKCLKENEINVHFSEIDDKHRFIKDSKYKDEKEWRLLHEYNGKLERALYGDTYAQYNEFLFEGNNLPDLNLTLVSVKIGPKQRKSNKALLIKDIKDIFSNVNVYY